MNANETKTVRRILVDAARVIRRHGLSRGSYRGNGTQCGPHCIVGAIREVCGMYGHDVVNDGRYEDAVRQVIRTVFGPTRCGNVESLFLWNDSPSRTGREVARVLEAAAWGYNR